MRNENFFFRNYEMKRRKEKINSNKNNNNSTHKKMLNGRRSIIKNIFMFHQMLLLRCSFSLIVYFIVSQQLLTHFSFLFLFLSPRHFFSSFSFNLLVIKSYDLRLFFSLLRSHNFEQRKIYIFYYFTLLVGIDGEVRRMG